MFQCTVLQFWRAFVPPGPCFVPGLAGLAIYCFSGQRRRFLLPGHSGHLYNTEVKINRTKKLGKNAI